ncbi:MAG: hypothetical protein R3C14_42175 [Caldilineaceae bacterium]
MQQNWSHDEEFSQNAKGYYSLWQIRTLVLWCLWHVLIFGTAGFSLAYGLQGILRIILLVVTSLFLLTTFFLYGSDLIQSAPVLVDGKLAKQIRKFRGPTHYDVIVEESDLRVRSLNKTQWLGIQDGKRYELYYTHRTKWLLSYRKLDIANDLPDSDEG